MSLLKRFVPAIGLGVLVALYVGSELADMDGRGTTAVAKGASAVFLIGPVAGAWAAWRASVLRRASVSDLAPSRGPLAVAGRQLTPVLVGSLAVLLYAVALALIAGGPIVSTPDLRIVGTVSAVVVGQMAIGYAVGILAPAVVSIPAVFVSLYLWMVFPQAWEPLWIRHMNGYASCCGLWADFDPGALIAPIVLAVAFAVASWVVVARDDYLGSRITLAVAVVALASLGAASLVRHLGPDPIQPRSPDDAICVEGEPTVCAWPENAERIGEIATIARRVRETLRSSGVDVPDTFTEAIASDDAQAGWYFGMRPTTSSRSIYGMAVAGLVPERFYSCPPPGRDKRDTMEAWLFVKTGLDRQQAAGGLMEHQLRELDVILGRPRSAQVRWYERNLALLERCVPTEPS